MFTREGDDVFSLTTRFEADPSHPYVYSAHYNKPGYLTSHLYAYMEDIPEGATRRLVVHHSLGSGDPIGEAPGGLPRRRRS